MSSFTSGDDPSSLVSVSNSKADTGTNASDDGPSALTSARSGGRSTTQGTASSADVPTAASEEDVMKGWLEKWEVLEKCVADIPRLLEDCWVNCLTPDWELMQKRKEEWNKEHSGEYEGLKKCLKDAIADIDTIISMDPNAIEDIGLLGKAAAVVNSAADLAYDLHVDLGRAEEVINWSRQATLRKEQLEQEIARRSEDSK